MAAGYRFEICKFKIFRFEFHRFKICRFEICTFEFYRFEICTFEICGMRLLGLTVMIFALALPSCVRREISNSHAEALTSQQSVKGQALPSCINLNLATAEQLMQLPGIGEVMSQRIIEYRKRHGPFRRPEEIIIIEGFSERKYRAVADLVCVR